MYQISNGIAMGIVLDKTTQTAIITNAIIALTGMIQDAQMIRSIPMNSVKAIH
jgi:hypothetical protein